MRQNDIDRVKDALYKSFSADRLIHIISSAFEKYKSKTCIVSLYGRTWCDACAAEIPKDLVDEYQFCPYCGAEFTEVITSRDRLEQYHDSL